MRVETPATYASCTTATSACSERRRGGPPRALQRYVAAGGVKWDDGPVQLGPRHVLLRGLRRAQHEPQLTQALAAVLAADTAAAAAFVRLALIQVGSDKATSVPEGLDCFAEEVTSEGRVDLRFSGDDWDLIVELKIHAGYGPGQLERYCEALRPVPYAGVLAITRDVPSYGEPPAGSPAGWLGATRWRQLLPGLRALAITDTELTSQWRAFLDVLEAEGSMGFTDASPELFSDFARARLARAHVEAFLRQIRIPLLQALQDTLGGQQTASFYFPRGRFSYSRDGRIDIPFKVPADGPWRLRAGVMGWEPPNPLLHVMLAPLQRWDTKLGMMPQEANSSVRYLAERGFHARWMRSHWELTPERVAAASFETDAVTWAAQQFAIVRDSGILAFEPTVLAAGDPVSESPEVELATET